MAFILNLLTGEHNFDSVKKCVYTESNYFYRTGFYITPTVIIAMTKYIITPIVNS